MIFKKQSNSGFYHMGIFVSGLEEGERLLCMMYRDLHLDLLNIISCMWWNLIQADLLGDMSLHLQSEVGNFISVNTIWICFLIYWMGVLPARHFEALETNSAKFRLKYRVQFPIKISISTSGVTAKDFLSWTHDWLMHNAQLCIFMNL